MKSINHLGESIPLIVEEDYKPVFLVGMNGSGTTMLLDSFSHHPDLFTFPRETRLLPSLIGSLEDFGCLDNDDNFLKLWKHTCTNHVFVRENKGEPLEIPVNWRDFPRNLASVVDAVFRYFSTREGKLRWCEKTPQHVQHLPKLHQLFPKAKFIHIIRDGRDCAVSINRRYKRTPEYSVYRWKKIVQMGRSDGVSLKDYYMEIRYEDITGSPEFWMRKICKFVDLPFDKIILESRRPMQKKEELPKAGSLAISGRLEPNSGNWRSYFTDKQIARMENIAGDFLEELNYPVISTPGSKDPSIIQQMIWKWRDFVRQLFGLVFRNNRYRWGLIFHHITGALSQSNNNRY